MLWLYSFQQELSGGPPVSSFLLLFFGFTVALTTWLVRFNPDPLSERLSGIGKSDQEKWDKVLLALTAVAFFCWLALMGMDAARFGWSHVPMWLQGLWNDLAIVLFLCFLYHIPREPLFISRGSSPER